MGGHWIGGSIISTYINFEILNHHILNMILYSLVYLKTILIPK